MPAIWNPRWSLSNHPAGGTVPRGTNAPAHRRAPPVVAYCTESASSQPAESPATSAAANTTTRPPSLTRGIAAATHSSGGNVARDEATRKAPLGSSSWRQRLTSKAAALPRTLFAVARNAHRFARGSTIKVGQSGRSTAKGTAGSPPPDPTSTTAEPSGANRAKAKESGRWSPTSSAALRAPVKLTRAFHCNSTSKNVAMLSACPETRARPQDFA